METASLIVIFRGAERVLIVAAATVCVWLGYRLFLALPTVHGSDGKLTLPGTTLTLSKVGPGVFFGLFGALVLWQSVSTVTTIPISSAAAAAPAAARATMANGDADAIVTLAQARIAIGILNCLAGNAPNGLHRQAVDAAVDKAKIALLEPAWPPGWSETSYTALRDGTVPPDGPIAEVMATRDPSCKGTSQ